MQWLHNKIQNMHVFSIQQQTTQCRVTCMKRTWQRKGQDPQKCLLTSNTTKNMFIAESMHTYLKSTYGSTLEAKICLEVLCNLTNKALEWQLPDKQLSGLLVSPNFSKGNSTWPTNNMKVLLVDSCCIRPKAQIYDIRTILKFVLSANGKT